MEAQELNKKMKRAYENMVDTIESLVDKEGKTLKEAVEIAEKKLSDWQELTKEESQKIIDEVKSDLKSIGETLNGAKEAYKEQFKLDAAYLTESIWEKLSKAADVGTEEFLAFTESLKERVQEIRMDDHASEHKEHLRWSSDHGFWLDEIELWKKDHQRALEKLQAIEARIKKHNDLLEEHAQAIRAHEALDHEHEEVMAANELDPTSKIVEAKDDKESIIHNQERQEHAKHAALHDSLKKDHRKMMALINHLYEQVVEG
jgi:hypothetical protein